MNRFILNCQIFLDLISLHAAHCNSQDRNILGKRECLGMGLWSRQEGWKLDSMAGLTTP